MRFEVYHSPVWAPGHVRYTKFVPRDGFLKLAIIGTLDHRWCSGFYPMPDLTWLAIDLPQILISLSALLLASHSPLGENLTLDTAWAKYGSHDMETIILTKPNLGVASQCELEDIVGLERGGGLGCWSRPTTASTLHFRSLFFLLRTHHKRPRFHFSLQGKKFCRSL